MKNLKEAVSDLIDSRSYLISYNMKAKLRNIFWDRYLATKDERVLKAVDDLVDLVFDKSEYGGPEGEEYPSFSREDESKVEALIAEIKKESK